MAVFVDHKVRFGPTTVANGASNTVVGSIDLNGSDLLNGVSASTLYFIGVWLLVYNTTDGAYPFFLYYEEAVQRLSGVWTIFSGTTPTAIKSVGAGGSISATFSITSTSVFNVRVSNAGSATYSAGGWMEPRMFRQ